MIKRLPLLFPLFILSLLFACQEQKQSSVNLGNLECILLSDIEGPKAEKGGVLFVYLYANNGDYAVDTRKERIYPETILVGDTRYEGTLGEGFYQLSKGDSAEFRVNNEALYTKLLNKKMPKSLKKDGYTSYFIKVTDYYTPDSVVRYNQYLAKRHNQRPAKYQEDTLRIKNYLIEKKMAYYGMSNGIFVVPERMNEGMPLLPGDSVDLFYTASVFEGKVFDSNVGSRPWNVVIGGENYSASYQQALDFGLQMLKRGDKAKIYIPAVLGFYDLIGAPAELKDAILVMDVEVLEQ